ncbi:MAG: hypothetical protein QUS07_05530 [Methanothrix sp.]|nr:hypothetical protein [Methanothrix sp.]
MEVLPTPAYKKKLYRGPLPLAAINAASACEKSSRHEEFPIEEAKGVEQQRFFGMIERLV